MRRSVRDAIVGFSIVGAIIAFSGATIWLRGLRIGAKAWSVTANFADASGLAERSPVTYRGILIGSVGTIHVTPKAVLASLNIDNGNLRLPLPVRAKLVTGSILGGDVQVALISDGKTLPNNAPLPISKDCFKEKILCNGAIINGEQVASISQVSETLEELLEDATEKKIIEHLASSTEQFELTQKNLDNLILQFKKEIAQTGPIIENLYKSSIHINNILATLDNQKTLTDFKETASSARSITQKIDELGGDVQKLIKDKEFMDAIRKVTIGLGEFFNEIYPSRTIN